MDVTSGQTAFTSNISIGQDDKNETVLTRNITLQLRNAHEVVTQKLHVLIMQLGREHALTRPEKL
jgi:hypothetical protein